jgi:hypothetical protein
MRMAVAAVLLGAGAPLFCQNAGTAPPSFENEKKDPPTVFLSQKELSTGPPVWHVTRDGLLKMNVPPGIGMVRVPSAPTDPEMVVHPPQVSLGVQPPGTQVAQNLYPGLQLMPIEQPKMKVEPIPTIFPNAKVEKIPTTWTQFTISPIQGGKVNSAAK